MVMNRQMNLIDYLLYGTISNIWKNFSIHIKKIYQTAVFMVISLSKKRYHVLWKIGKNFKNEFLKLLKMILKNQNISMTTFNLLIIFPINQMIWKNTKLMVL